MPLQDRTETYTFNPILIGMAMKATTEYDSRFATALKQFPSLYTAYARKIKKALLQKSLSDESPWP